MKLQDLIIMRHGASDHHGFLLPEAREIIQRLGLSLKNSGFIKKDTIFACSQEKRAIKTLHAIMRGADINVLENCSQELFSNETVCDVPGALRVIGEYLQETQSLIVVTHLEMAGVLPGAFGREVLHVDTFPENINLYHGEGVEIDCVEPTMKYLDY